MPYRFALTSVPFRAWVGDESATFALIDAPVLLPPVTSTLERGVYRYLVFNEQGVGTVPYPKNFCGAERDRTDDLRLAKPALSQLSYSPE